MLKVISVYFYSDYLLLHCLVTVIYLPVGRGFVFFIALQHFCSYLNRPIYKKSNEWVLVKFSKAT